MPDLPTPQDAAEAALFSECWDAVLAYADLCTSGSTAAAQLGREAFAHGTREARAAEAGPVRSAGRRPARLPRIPLLLTAVRTMAASWEEDGQGHKLDPDLRLWLNSDKAARYTGPPLQRPLALRGLRDLQQADAELLWLAEVEALDLPVVARRLGLDPDTVAEELQQVRTLFRDRCHRNHLDTPMDARCRSYARLLDAVTRSCAADAPGDLSRHLATCVQCAEAAACLRLHGGGLPGALAGGVIGWGGLAYLERRRRAAEVRLGAGRPGPAGKAAGEEEDGTQKARVARNGLLVAAVLVSLLALGVSMMPFGGSGDDLGARGDARRQPVADPNPSLPSPPSLPPATSKPAATATATASEGEEHTERPGKPEDGDDDRRTEPQGTSSPTGRTEPGESEDPACRVEYDLVNQWPDGFQATVTVTSSAALDSWRVSWSFRDGQRVGQMWDASVSQDGSRVTATAADYNKSVPAGSDLAFGFIASWRGKNSPPYGFTLNGHDCAKSG
ncbi:cellulose-binding protein [Streptomyces viridochromogenes DSM 40736]|uniref:Cellulose-binding protein n=1 Tax=Streptomyces viridochromogenes (strain DSM 40736 / JCM 4977 / BCRC 1201 / Tue 494) TaxID=591159 RepID=D9X2U2_STRVT|nr:cellulose-binding domain-containing protein [Streptomyces viridochromogenes]EFL35779.1 cellulose-binding protein [Streptomyces viridochromogenes DSM 40736]